MAQRGARYGLTARKVNGARWFCAARFLCVQEMSAAAGARAVVMSPRAIAGGFFVNERAADISYGAQNWGGRGSSACRFSAPQRARCRHYERRHHVKNQE